MSDIGGLANFRRKPCESLSSTHSSEVMSCLPEPCKILQLTTNGFDIGHCGQTRDDFWAGERG